jgi:hypothetical protein
MSKEIVLSVPLIEKRILLIRGQKVMLSSDLAGLYGVKPKTLTRLSNGMFGGSRRISCSGSRLKKRKPSVIAFVQGHKL